MSSNEDAAPLIWGDFAVAAPPLAAQAQDLFERFGFVFVGTIRADGTPRISAVEVHLVRGHLMLVIVAGSQKANDLRRDRRLVLQTPVTDPSDPGAEFKLRGTALAVDAGLRADTTRTVQATSGWRPRESWQFVDVRVRTAALLAWTPQEGDMLLTRWDRDHGLRATQRRRLDLEESRYRRRQT